MVNLQNFRNKDLKQSVQNLADNFGIKTDINVKKVKGMSAETYGCTAKIYNSHWILISPDCPAEKLNEVVAHEMVHVWQTERGDLEFDYDNQIFYWKGQKWDLEKLNEVQYYDRPWENEAKSIQEELTAKFF